MRMRDVSSDVCSSDRIGVQPSRQRLDGRALVGTDIVAVVVEEYPVADLDGEFFLGARSRTRNGSRGPGRGLGSCPRAAGAAAGRRGRLFGRSGARSQQQGRSESGNKGKAHNLPSQTHPRIFWIEVDLSPVTEQRSEEHTSELQSL